MIRIQEAKDKNNVKSRIDSLLKAIRQNRILTLVVEPASKCNLTCSFCDLHSGRIENVNKYKGVMSQKTFDVLADQLICLGYELEQFQIHGNGEPLLNKQLDKFIKSVSQKKVAKVIRLTTNGTMLVPKRLENLIACGINEIRVSLDVADRNMFSKFKGKDLYEKVKNNLMNAIERIELCRRCMLVIKYPIPGPELQYGVTQDFVDSVFEIFGSFAKSSHYIHLLGMPVITLPLGVLSNNLASKKCVACDDPCEIPFYSLYIKYDGRVSVCCADITDILDIGNIHHQHLRDIITGERLRELRVKHLQSDLKEIPICQFCGNRTCVDIKPIAGELMNLI